MNFDFVGPVPASKSILNRALVCQSYFPILDIHGDSKARDVSLMRGALAKFLMGQDMDCGHAGTVFRFVALRVSRHPGRFTLKGSPRLFSRPMDELIQVLSQLGVDVEVGEQELVIDSRGWKLMGDGLHIDCSRSSQFASAVLLNAWNFEQTLHISLNGLGPSEGYLKMTIQLLRRLGMDIQEAGSELVIPAKQELTQPDLHAELDMSSAFALCALAAVSGSAKILNWMPEALQPDQVFVPLLKKMGVFVHETSDQLQIKNKGEIISPGEVDLKNCPDLFPVLGALCALAKGETKLFGAGHLRFKESQRIEKVAELISLMGRKVETREDGLIILAKSDSDEDVSGRIFEYNTDQDHRLVMAATVALYAGHNVRIINPFNVIKSFPEFLNYIPQESQAVLQ